MTSTEEHELFQHQYFLSVVDSQLQKKSGEKTEKMY